jgi:hypothetical protein
MPAIIEISVRQGCQMVYFQTKNPNLGKIWGAWSGKGWYYIIYMAMNILQPFGIVYGQLVIYWQAGTFSAVLVHCVKKNLANPVFGSNTWNQFRARL